MTTGPISRQGNLRLNIFMLTLDQKKEQKAWIREQLSSNQQLVLIGFRGLTIAQMSDLRQRLAVQKMSLKVIKNTILTRALTLVKVKLDQDTLAKPIGLIVGSSDEVATVKLVNEFAKEHPALEFLAGWINHELVGASLIDQLANIPGRDDLLARLVGSIAAPLVKLNWSLQWNLYSFHSILSQRLGSSSVGQTES